MTTDCKLLYITEIFIRIGEEDRESKGDGASSDEGEEKCDAAQPNMRERMMRHKTANQRDGWRYVRTEVRPKNHTRKGTQVQTMSEQCIKMAGNWQDFELIPGSGRRSWGFFSEMVNRQRNESQLKLTKKRKNSVT